MKKHSLTKQKEVTEDKPTRAQFHHGSTTQGGSNFGQGSAQLGRNANRQGSESGSGESEPGTRLPHGTTTGTGSDYGNEKKWNNEALRRKDISKSRQ